MRLSSMAERVESHRLQLLACELCGAESGRLDKDGYPVQLAHITILRASVIVCRECKAATSEVQKVREAN